MKKLFKILLVALVVSAGTVTTNEVKSQAVNVSFSVFYNSLKPYGRWVNHGTYGQVWISNTRGFSPYSTGGHWAYTDYGWTWVSDYDWGWAPFHYGRWAYERGYGWYWVPGYEWAPAWVAWRGGGDYYGWAPLSPGLSFGVDFSFGNQIPYDRWIFAPHRYITSRYISRYYVPRSRNTVIIRNTKIVNNVTVKNNVHYVAGPRKDEVERINHTRIQTLTVANSSRPGKTVVNKNTVNVYRPVINDNDKTVIDKNSNNTTVNKNSNNTTVKTNNTEASKDNTKGKNNNAVSGKNNTEVKKNSTTEANKNSTTTEKKNPDQQKPAVKKNSEPQKPPTSSNTTDRKQKAQAAYEHPNVAKSKAADMSKDKKQQITQKAQTQKQKANNDKKHKPENNPPK